MADAVRPAKMEGHEGHRDLINAKPPVKSSVEAGTKITPRLASKLAEEGFKELLVSTRT
jgi:DNA-directed RNA polymerase subunit beta